MKQILTLHINGDEYVIACAPNQTLVEVLREQLHLTGTKKGCNDGDCGACTVLMDGRPVPSCTLLAFAAQGHEILTIEGVAKGGQLHPLQQAFIDQFAIQCGFCTPGMIMTALALLEENPNPSEDEIRDYMRGNLCRCTGYNNIVKAVEQARDVLLQQKVTEDVSSAEGK